MKTLGIKFSTTSLIAIALGLAPLAGAPANQPAQTSAPPQPAVSPQPPAANAAQPQKPVAAQATQEQAAQGSAKQVQAITAPVKPPRIASKDMQDHTAHRLAGSRIRGSDGKSLGKVKDFLIDTESGKVAFAVVASGGLAGIGDELRLIPFSAVRRTGSEQKFSVDLDEAQWKELVVVDEKEMDQPNITISDAQRHRIAQAFSRGTAATADADSSYYTAAISGHLVRASALEDRKIRSGNGYAGKIEGVVIDAGTKEASALFDPARDFTGSPQKFLIPIEELSIGEGKRSELAMAFTPQDFRNVQTGKNASAQQVASSNGQMKMDRGASVAANAASTPAKAADSSGTVTSTPESQDVALGTSKKSGHDQASSSNAKSPAEQDSSKLASHAQPSSVASKSAAGEPKGGQQQVASATTSSSAVREDQPNESDQKTGRSAKFAANNEPSAAHSGSKQTSPAPDSTVARSDAQLSPTGKTAAEQTPYGNNDAALVDAAKAVRTALDDDPSVARADVRVMPEQGKLFLRGSVKSAEIKRSVEMLAKKSAGDREIQSEIIVGAK